MQVTFRGLALEQARDLVFDTKVPNYGFVRHKGTGKTVLMVLAPAERAVATELSNMRDWQAVDGWSSLPLLTKLGEVASACRPILAAMGLLPERATIAPPHSR